MSDRPVANTQLAARHPTTAAPPIAAFVRLREVEARTGLCGKTIYRKMARGEFPRSIRIGANAVAWREADLQDWMANPMCWTAAA